MKKLFTLLSMLIVLIASPFGSAFAQTEDLTEELTINLQDIDFSQLKPGDQIQVGDLTITQYSYEDAAKIIAENTGESEEEILKNFESKAKLSATGDCAVGTTAFSRRVEVNSNYKPQVNIMTELCENSSGDYVVKNIVDMSMNRLYNGISKEFRGTINAQALNSGYTLYYRVDGDFYNYGDTRVGGKTGLNTPYATVEFEVSGALHHYGYIYHTDNIRL